MKKTEGRWEPNKNENDQDKIALKQLNFILNKLTMKTFEKLSNEMLELITTEEILREFANMIYEKAINEHSFSRLYADLCDYLSTKDLSFNTENNLRKFVLNRCQSEFENKSSLDKTNKTNEQIMEEEFYIKRKIIGNIILVGELFCLGVINYRILKICLERLMPNSDQEIDPENVEALCKLLTNTGAKFEQCNEDAKNYCKEYYNKLGDLSKNSCLLPRYRFMILDLLDLKNNNWESKDSPNPTSQHQQKQKRIITINKSSPLPRKMDEKQSQANHNNSNRNKKISIKKSQKTSPRKGESTGDIYHSPKEKTSFISTTPPPSSYLLSTSPHSQDFSISENSLIIPTIMEGGQDIRSVLPSSLSDNSIDLESHKKKINDLLMEYFDCQEYEEAVFCIQDLNIKSQHFLIIYQFIQCCFQASDKERNLTFDLIDHLKNESILETNDLQKG